MIFDVTVKIYVRVSLILTLVSMRVRFYSFCLLYSCAPSPLATTSIKRGKRIANRIKNTSAQMLFTLTDVWSSRRVRYFSCFWFTKHFSFFFFIFVLCFFQFLGVASLLIQFYLPTWLKNNTYRTLKARKKLSENP